MREIGGARKPGQRRSPAEPPQRPRGDVLRNPGAARAALIIRGVRQRGNLNEIEVVEQADPGDACQNVYPDDETGHKELYAPGCEANDNGKHDAGGNNARYRIKRIHVLVLPDDVFVMAVYSRPILGTIATFVWRPSMRLLLVLLPVLLISGCTSMLLGGGGTYSPPEDRCQQGNEEGNNDNCQ